MFAYEYFLFALMLTVTRTVFSEYVYVKTFSSPSLFFPFCLVQVTDNVQSFPYFFFPWRVVS